MEHKLTEERKDFLEKDYRRGFIKFCGLHALKIEQGFFESSVVIGENHKTQDDFIHAGLIATMSDHTAGYAAYTVVPENIRVLTIEFKINLLSPANGERFRAVGTVKKCGRHITVTEGELFTYVDGGPKLVATMVGTIMSVYDREGVEN